MEVFAFVKEKACNRLNGWRHKLLSRAGKEVLLKAVIQVLPTYVMSVFLLPLLLCDNLERMMNSFWLGQSDHSRGGLKWKSWDKLTLHKANGGLGFRKLHLYNLALLAKQSWKLFTEPNSLASRVLKARYYPQSSFFEAKLGANPSYAWRNIVATQELIKRGSRIRFGNGSNTLIWGAPWIPDKDQPLVSSDCPLELQQTNVSSLRLSDGGNWDVDLIDDIFNERDKNLIIFIPLSNRNIVDKC
ncbi:uncharacterized mitochondrial protein AtMg00310-like [Henckelia pumila]|uniref:uncharacterized mitochondrial protein AtMg00310-like n=1 Tax=Henckelia pumila TaxID=405737 RepID=UPI003C6E612C